jgi:hypothetical protein
MFPSEHESRYITHQHPQGGTAPSRYDLALHEYMRKQHNLRKVTPNAPATSKLNSMMRWFFNRLESLDSRHVADRYRAR